MKRTNLVLDAALLERARSWGGAASDQDAIRAALEPYRGVAAREVRETAVAYGVVASPARGTGAGRRGTVDRKTVTVAVDEAALAGARAASAARTISGAVEDALRAFVARRAAADLIAMSGSGAVTTTAAELDASRRSRTAG